MVTKDVTQLNPMDFREYPIWIPTEDQYNEDEVSPCDSCDSIPLEGIYYVSASFRLSDRSEYSGFIRFSEGETMAIAIASTETEFVFYSLSDAIREALGDTKSAFARKLGKKSQDVFPLEYQTLFHTDHNVAIGGTID
jgi:hypothetical protein